MFTGEWTLIQFWSLLFLLATKQALECVTGREGKKGASVQFLPEGFFYNGFSSGSCSANTAVKKARLCEKKTIFDRSNFDGNVHFFKLTTMARKKHNVK